MTSLIELLSPTKNNRRVTTSNKPNTMNSPRAGNEENDNITTRRSSTRTRKPVVDLSQDNVKRMRMSTPKSRQPFGKVLSSTLNQGKGQDDTAKSVQSPCFDKNDVGIIVGSAKKSSAVTQSQSITPEQQSKAPCSALAVDDRVRVYYDRGQDIFGEDREAAGGYWYGTISSVSNSDTGVSSYNIQVIFDNGEVDEFEYPTEDDTLERVLNGCAGDNTKLLGERSGEFAGQENPSEVNVGDLVFCNYRNQEKRYRGRIAAVADRPNGGLPSFCSVAYDDGEYEEGIPIGLGKIFLVQFGDSVRQWIDGVKLKRQVGRSKRKEELTIKLIPDDEDMVELQHANGSIEKQPYHEVVQDLFAEVKRTAEKTKKLWAWPSSVQWLDEKSQQEVPGNETASKKRATRKAKKIIPDAPASKTASNISDCRPIHFASDPWLSDLSEDEDEEETEKAIAHGKDMSNSIRNSFFKALNSTEAGFGSELLFKMTNFHNRPPNDELCRDLVDLLWKGPLHQKQIRYPDCIRLEMLNNYFKLVRAARLGARLAKVLSPTFAQDVLEQVEKPAVIYCVEGDEGRFTAAALLRVGQTLNVKNSGASLLCFLLQHQLRGYKRLGAHLDEKDGINIGAKKEAFKEVLQGRDLTREILQAGSIQALKLTTRAAFSILVHYGHYLSSDFSFPPPPPATTATTNLADLIPPHATSSEQSFVATETRRLVKCMGQLCSYMAWVYCIDQGVSLYQASFVIRDSVEGLLSSSSFDPSMFLSDATGKNDATKMMRRHWTDMKLQFALSLDKRISGHLGMQTAQLFKCGTQHF